MAKKETIKKINRILLILNKLDSGAVNLQNTADELGVNVRSIQRDIKLIEEAGFPIYSEGSGQYAFIEGFSLKKENISGQEASMLVLMNEFAGTLGANFETIFKNLKQKFISSGREDNPFYIKMQKGVDYKQTPILKVIENAVSQREIIKVSYSANNNKSEYPVKPLKIAWIDGFWYLLALAPKGRLLKLRTERIMSAENTGKDFKYTKDIARLIKEGTNIWFEGKRDINVRISVDSSCAEYFKVKKYFPMQKIEKENKDGSLTISSKASKYEEVFSTIMHWIPNLKVLEPKELADLVKRSVKDYIKKL